MSEIRKLTCSDGHTLCYRVWSPSKGVQVKAVLHILHGMAEYSERYDKFAQFLVNHDIAVYCQDHRGHGLTAQENNDQLGFLAEKDGWQRIAADSFELDNVITNDYPKLSLFLMGHSMGSFLARTVMVQHPDLFSGVIIMGSGSSKGLVGRIGRMLAVHSVKKHGLHYVDEKIDKMSFGSYNSRIPDCATSFDWLSRDPVEVQKYIKDPLCGFKCPAIFFVDLLDGIEYANNPKNVLSIPKDLPLLIINGTMDPVGDYGKGARKVYDLYKDAGISDVHLSLVQEARHELLNETNRKSTCAYLLKWITDRI
ncbi:MAG: alpha/beta fold hydrolase [Sphaerochaetaceae bacterium]